MKNSTKSSDTAFKKDLSADKGKVSESNAINTYLTSSVYEGYKIFNFSKEKPESKMTPFEKMDLSRRGISKNDLINLKSKSGLDYNRLAAALSVTRATLINKKGSEKFSPTLSEKIIDLANIYSYGYEVFGDIQKFNKWMDNPNTALGGVKPIDVIDNQFGREEVKHIIGRIDHGVYS